MYMVRSLLVVIMALSASLAGAVEGGHMPVQTHDHAVAESVADDLTNCCADSSERAQTCHALPVLVPSIQQGDAATTSGEDVFYTSRRFMTGIELSGPLDPPRAV